MGDPVVLITGCSSGIGRALAQAFHARGCDVWATARQESALRELAAAGMRIAALDVCDPVSIDALRGRLDGAAIDILVNNAGYGQMGPLLDLDAAALRAQFETNVVALHAVTRAFAPAMMARQRGLVIQMGSVSGVLTTPFAGAYCASKAAVHALSDALRMELAPFGVRVMTVQPGAIQSDFGIRAGRSLDVAAGDSAYAAVADGIAARAKASQQHAMTAAALARRIVDAALRADPPARLRAGGGARLLPLLAAALPRALRDRLLSRRFGLDRLRS